jgi:hypothetical protein
MEFDKGTIEDCGILARRKNSVIDGKMACCIEMLTPIPY